MPREVQRGMPWEDKQRSTCVHALACVYTFVCVYTFARRIQPSACVRGLVGVLFTKMMRATSTPRYSRLGSATMNVSVMICTPSCDAPPPALLRNSHAELRNGWLYRVASGESNLSIFVEFIGRRRWTHSTIR